MQRQGDETHFETDEARGASSPNIVRWVLAISLFAAIAAMSVIWITGAATRDEGEKYVTVPGQADNGSTTDSIVGENADKLEAAEPGDTAEAVPSVENQAADEAPKPAAT